MDDLEFQRRLGAVSPTWLDGPTAAPQPEPASVAPPEPSAAALRAVDALRQANHSFPCQDTWEKRELVEATAQGFGVSPREVLRAMRAPVPQRTARDYGATVDPALTPEQCGQIDAARLELAGYLEMGLDHPPDDFEPPPVAGWITECQWEILAAQQEAA